MPTQSFLIAIAARRDSGFRGHRAPGFTLIELLLVIMIIMIIAGLTIFAMGQVFKGSKEAAARSTVRELYMAIETFKSMDTSAAYPAAAANFRIVTNGTTGILDLLQSKAGFSWDRNAITADPTNGDYLVDPWDQPYLYVPKGSANAFLTNLVSHDIVIYSCGPGNWTSGATSKDAKKWEKPPIICKPDGQ